MNEHAVAGDAVELGLNKQTIEMLQHAVNSAVGDDAHEVELGGRRGFDAGDHAVPSGVIGELFFREELVQADEFLVNDTAGADVFMTDLGVAHLAIGQTHIETTRGHVGDGRGGLKRIVDRLLGKGHGVGGGLLGMRIAAPAVADDEKDRFTRCVHNQSLHA